MLSRANRLARKDDIANVSKGRGERNEYISLKFLANGLTCSRFAFVISSKAIKKASKRNLIKRRAREIIRVNLDGTKKGYDIVIFFSYRSQELGYNELHANILSLLSRARLIK